jgi:hypothetical protein
MTITTGTGQRREGRRRGGNEQNRGGGEGTNEKVYAERCTGRAEN